MKTWQNGSFSDGSGLIAKNKFFTKKFDFCINGLCNVFNEICVMFLPKTCIVLKYWSMFLM